MQRHISLPTVLFLLMGVSVALGQDASSGTQPGRGRQGNQAPGRSDPHIVPPRATPDLHPPNAPALPYYFVAQPAPMPGQKFGNVSGVALTAQGHLLGP